MNKESIEFSTLDQSEQKNLMNEIVRILEEQDSHNKELFTESIWNWQYKDLPSRKSIVCICKNNTNVLGYYHIPIYNAVANETKINIGNIQDVAVSKNTRGMGVFRKLSSFANDEIFKSKQVDLIYTFPNNNSIHTFVKYLDYKIIGTLGVYIYPIRIDDIIQSKLKIRFLSKCIGMSLNILLQLTRTLNNELELVKCHEIDDQIAQVFHESTVNFGYYLARSKDYLNWRYLQSPKGKHQIIKVFFKDEFIGAFIFKEDEMFQSKVLLLMDFAIKNGKENLAKSALYKITKESNSIFSNNFSLILFSGSIGLENKIKALGFYKVPNSFNPRKLNLLTKKINPLINEDMFSEKNWYVTLGDWDVF